MLSHYAIQSISDFLHWQKNNKKRTVELWRHWHEPTEVSQKLRGPDQQMTLTEG